MTAEIRKSLPPSLLAAGLVLFLVGLGGVLVFRPWHRPPPPAAIPLPQGREIMLYFASPVDGKYLQRSVRLQENLAWVEQIKNILDGMFAQPATAGEATLWPFSLRVRSVYLLKNGPLILDLEEGVQYNQNSTAFTELRVVRSVVHTLLANFPEVRAVKFLINGSEAATLAGHIDISRALGEDD